MKKGDIILLPFPFTDLSGKKTRPALVLIENQKDVVVAFITSQLKWKEAHDMEVLQSPQNGLKTHSVIRLSKLATLDKELVMGKLGTIDKLATQELNQKLAKIFQLKDHSTPD